MATYNYKIYDIDPEGLEKYSEQDTSLIPSYIINNSFNTSTHAIELHVYSVEGTLLYSEQNYNNQKYLQGSGTATGKTSSELTIDPIKDLQIIGYPEGGVKVVYNFLDNLFSEDRKGGEFFIEEISSDRLELRLITTQIPEETLISYVADIRSKLQNQAYYADFRVNLGNNELLIGINIDTQQYRGGTSLIVKLYEPLPDNYSVKQTTTLSEIISDSIGYEIEAELQETPSTVPYVKGPNFNFVVEEDTAVPSQYLNYNELFGYPTSNNYRELTSLFNENSVDISIDYSDLSNFVFFSSADERIRNFKYKLDLIENYQELANSASLSTGLQTGSINFYTDQINSILENFDHYDRHLYYDSGSSSWPKLNSNKPYINDTTPTTSSWYNQATASAILFDDSNVNQLIYTVPEYLREDPQNAPYNTFIHMVGQHFDNLWVYTKAVTDKYDNDNRPNVGISRDLVQDALKNFGVKIYSSNKSTEDLFKTFTGELYQLTEEEFGDRLSSASLISASSNPTPEDLYRKEIHKRIYHNLPLILKAKGTERGVKALITSFGIPTDNNILGATTSSISGSHYGLKTRLIGGNTRVGDIFISPVSTYTSSLAKIRIDNTGSVTTGSTLSTNTSIVQREDKYTDDLHSVEIGFSTSDVVDERVVELLPSGYDIDNYIGDPALAFYKTYPGLISSSNAYVGEAMVSGSHDLQDFVRILKFYDNVIFKMVKDYIPARSNISSGIIVKPHLLERNKIKQVEVYSSQSFGFTGSAELTATGSFDKVYKQFIGDQTFTGSIQVGNYSGTHGGSFKSGSSEYTTSYIERYVAPFGVVNLDRHNHEEPKFNGEFSGSGVKVSNGELNINNTYKYDNPTNVSYTYTFIDIFATTPTPTPSPTPTPTPSATPTLEPSATPTPTPTLGGPTSTPSPTPTQIGVQYGTNSINFPGTAVGEGVVVWTGFTGFANSMMLALTGQGTPVTDTYYNVIATQVRVSNSTGTYLNDVIFSSSQAKVTYDGGQTTIRITNTATPSSNLSGNDNFYYAWSY